MYHVTQLLKNEHEYYEHLTDLVGQMRDLLSALGSTSDEAKIKPLREAVKEIMRMALEFSLMVNKFLDKGRPGENYARI